LAGSFWDLRDEDDLTWVAHWLDRKVEWGFWVPLAILFVGAPLSWLAGALVGVLLAQVAGWAIAALALSGITAGVVAFVLLQLPLVSLAPHLALTTKLRNRSAEMLLTVPYLAFVIGACSVSRVASAVPSAVQGQLATLNTVVLVAVLGTLALPQLWAWRHRREPGG